MLEYMRKRQGETKAQEAGTEQAAMSAGVSNQAMISMLESQQERPATRPASGGTPLADAMRAKFERQFGLPMDDVRIHRDSAEPAKFDARAYTYGTDVFIGPGQEELIDHEMTHVAQQKMGQVRPTGMEHGMAVNRSPALEHSADIGAVTQTMGTAAGPVVQCCPRDVQCRNNLMKQLPKKKVVTPSQSSNSSTLFPGHRTVTKPRQIPIYTQSGKGSDQNKMTYSPISRNPPVIKPVVKKEGLGNVKQNTAKNPVFFRRPSFLNKQLPQPNEIHQETQAEQSLSNQQKVQEKVIEQLPQPDETYQEPPAEQEDQNELELEYNNWRQKIEPDVNKYLREHKNNQKAFHNMPLPNKDLDSYDEITQKIIKAIYLFTKKNFHGVSVSEKDGIGSAYFGGDDYSLENIYDPRKLIPEGLRGGRMRFGHRDGPKLEISDSVFRQHEKRNTESGEEVYVREYILNDWQPSIGYTSKGRHPSRGMLIKDPFFANLAEDQVIKELIYRVAFAEYISNAEANSNNTAENSPKITRNPRIEEANNFVNKYVHENLFIKHFSPEELHQIIEEERKAKKDWTIGSFKRVKQRPRVQPECGCCLL